MNNPQPKAELENTCGECQDNSTQCTTAGPQEELNIPEEPQIKIHNVRVTPLSS